MRDARWFESVWRLKLSLFCGFCSLGREAALDHYGDFVTGVFADCGSNRLFNGELVGAVAQSHEGTLEGEAVDFAFDLDQTTGGEELRGLGPYNVGPAAFLRARLEFCREFLGLHF